MALPLPGILIAIVATQAAAGQQPGSGAGLALRLAPALADLGTAQGEKKEEAPPPRAAKPFGKQESWRWYIQGGLALDIESASSQLYLFGGGVSYFIVDDLSLNVELNGLYVHQSGDDAAGINLAFLARFHFLKWERWSVYADVGSGILETTSAVPSPSPGEPRGGTKFNFTPEAGMGFSFEVRPDEVLMVGVRWFHISSANTWPNNPGLNTVMLYAGVSVPF